MDPRLTPANPRVAALHLKGRVAAPSYVAGSGARVVVPVADLLAAPDGPRNRQLLFGAPVTVFEQHEGWAFVQAAHDGYVGWLAGAALGADAPATHWVCAPASHVYPHPGIKQREVMALSFGARLTVVAEHAHFAELDCGGFVPLVHLRPLGAHFTDPVAVAELFLGTPYLWGGNSRAGIDCSGLVQAAHLACGFPCPADSDLQCKELGRLLAPGTPFRRGDLLFWKGHVALVADEDRILHANAHSMAVSYEDTGAALARILAAGLPLLAHKRL